MSLPKLYLETTIPSYLVARRNRDIVLAGQQEATSRWWEQCRHKYELCVSQFVDSEAARGDPEMAAARGARLEGISRLPVTEEALAHRRCVDRRRLNSRETAWTPRISAWRRLIGWNIC